jgi:hypothetical protein
MAIINYFYGSMILDLRPVFYLAGIFSMKKRNGRRGVAPPQRPMSAYKKRA